MNVRRPSARGEFEIAIICALPLEFDAVKLLFDEHWDENGDQYGRALGDRNFYSTGRIGKNAVVLVLLPSMGKSNAAIASASMQSSYPGLRLTFVVGICGGIPRSPETGEIFLGDVIISKSIVQYDMGKQYPHAFLRINTDSDSMGRPSKIVRNLMTTFETDYWRDWLLEKATGFMGELQAKAALRKRDGKYRGPSTADDKLFEPAYRHKHRRVSGQPCSACDKGNDSVCDEALLTACEDLRCDERYLVKRARSVRPRGSTAQNFSVHMGAIASGDQVMKSGEHRDAIARSENVIAFEMEGTGVWGQIPCIVIKGVCDYADSHKHKRWQNFAAATAASTTKAMLLRYA